MRTRLQFALLASSALVGFSSLLQTASAARSAAAGCSAVLANRSQAAIERFLKEYPVDGQACLATATTSQGAGSSGGSGGHGGGSGGGSGSSGGGSGHGSGG
jgi:uncharacterized membrane protein YgcG